MTERGSSLSFRRKLVIFKFDNQLVMYKGNYFVYILTNPRKTVLYTGVTNDLYTRVLQHYKNRGVKKSFAGRYYCYKLIYYEIYQEINMAIEREKEIKDLSRQKKEELINSMNPQWNILAIGAFK